MKIFCVGRNYADHAKELQNEVPQEPVIFLKPKSAVVHSSNPCYYPEFTNELHYEAELVIRISKNGRYITSAAANKFYDAITVGIDFTARDLQSDLKKKGLPWEKAKAWDGSALIGQWLPFTSDIHNNVMNFYLNINGNKVQEGNSKQMIFSFNEIIVDISKFWSLNIGDVIFTGTPAGVGECVVGDKLEGFLNDKSVFLSEIK